MHLYRVIDTSTHRRLLAMSDGAGAHHVARAMAALPDIGMQLHGRLAAPGLHLLRGTSPPRTFQVVFESIDCGQTASLARLRPAAQEDGADHPPLNVYRLPLARRPARTAAGGAWAPVCGACMALNGQGRGALPHAALQLTHRRRVDGSMRGATLIYCCRACDADLRCAGAFDDTPGWAVVRPPRIG